ncbi:MAG: ATP-binding cassette domain-containing protein [Acidobacteria bacterium]|nr:ATP-binding cassette domain-containing protein [Acidobacteriota bacterium]
MSDLQRLRRWLRRAAPRRGELVRALVAAAVASLAGTGLFVGALALLVVSAQRPGLRAIAVFLIVIELVAFLRSPLRFAERMSTHRLGFAAVAHWRQWLMGTVGRWSYSRWQRHATGDLLERSLTDTEELQDLWLRAVVPSVATLVTMTLSDVAVALLAPLGHWWAVALGTAVVQAVLVAAVLQRLGAMTSADRTLRQRRGAYVASLVSARAAAPEIERLGASAFLHRRDQRVAGDLRDAEDAANRERRRGAWVVALGPLLALAILALAHPVSAGVWPVVAGLVAFATFDALISLRGAVAVAVAVTGGAERLDQLASDHEGASIPDAPWPVDHTLRFEDLVVRSAGPRRSNERARPDHERLGGERLGGERLGGERLGAAPEDPRSDPRDYRVSGIVTPGRRVAVVGPSGVGKSTLLRALARLDDVVAGTVSLGPRDAADIAEEEWRAHVVLVPSEPGLFRGYVRDVVGLGLPLGDEDLASLSALGLRVERNDQWEELSRGERQRVALVRALLRRPDILLLDEPTSALGEAETLAVLALLSRVPASMIIATHDPRVRQWCDDVIDFEDPRFA